jgi:hypothetical protein
VVPPVVPPVVTPPPPPLIPSTVPVATEIIPVTANSTPTAKTVITFQLPATTATDNQLVELTVPPKSTSSDTNWSVKSTVTAAAITSGYATLQIVATAISTGADVTKFAIPLELHIARAATDGIPAYSLDDGLTWTELAQLTSNSLPANLNEGYFVNTDGSMTLFTRHLTLFGIRKPTPVVEISTTTNQLELGDTSFLIISGGAGSGNIRFQTSTPKVCAVSPTGFIVGLAAGNCFVTATKYASEIFIDTTSNPLKIVISDAASRKAAADAAAAAAAAAAKAAAAAANASNQLIRVGISVNGVTPIRVNLGIKYAKKSIVVTMRSKVKGKTITTKLGTTLLNAKGVGTFTTKIKIPVGSVLNLALAPVTITTSKPTKRAIRVAPKRPAVKTTAI